MQGYIFNFQGKAFAPDGQVCGPVDVDAHNKRLEESELAECKTRPVILPAYVSERHNEVTTWLGTKLGTITSFTKFDNNFGGVTACVTVRATNGATYYGRFGYHSGDFVRLRKTVK